ncbi:thioesterase II family protein [Rhizobium sp. AP16]|uniref:thioesterase II family protein n=1 Tax=Rhizobium sp. AP16 TaxID=1144306 RepID=UPI00026ED890|nr:alpha/beta fold hydrolase [Rhizobium sp. AP16]EJK79839.1 putative thioesterase involved in non-ribosomal peptide biosynthesis [Rhizobium sp. AP16]
MSSSRWFVNGQCSSPRLRLYCFSHAGGDAASYLGWQAALAPDIEISGIRLPGRGSRFHEAPYRSLDDAVAAVTPVIAAASASIRFAFFGHSLGALMAFEVARSLRRQQLSEPTALIVSGADAPDTRDPRRRLSALGDDALLDALTAFNGIPADLLGQRELMELCLPTTRADFEMVETYRYVPDEPLAIPIDVLAGRTDTHIRLDQVATWKNQTSASCTVEWFDGDHFFIDAERDQVLPHLRGILDCRTPAH